MMFYYFMQKYHPNQLEQGTFAALQNYSEERNNYLTAINAVA